MGQCVDLKGCVFVAVLDNLLKVHGQKSRDGAVDFVLVNMAKFMREPANGIVAATEQDGIAEREARHMRTKKTSLKGGGAQHRVLGDRKAF